MIAIGEDYYESGEIIALVGCGKQKRGEDVDSEDRVRHYAKDLYTSTYFSLKRDVSEEHADRWYILSAEHGLISPSYPLEYYDTSMKDLDDEETREWGQDVAAALVARSEEFEESPAEVVAVFAGKDYYEPLLDALPESFPLDVVLPFDGLGFHKQMSYLSEQTPEE